MNAKEKLEPPKDENGKPMLTEEYIQALCEENGGYSTPQLNDILYLHFKGFDRIQCLEKYKNIKCLWLENNGLKRIEGLENNKKLRMIFLQQNMIREIENISHLTKLVKLNLSNNLITRITGLKGLNELQTLQLSHNNISDTADCQELLELPSLTSLDMKNNQLDNKDTIVPFFSQLQTLHSLYLQNNPAIRNVSMYRKQLVAALENLNQLDDRQVSELEHVYAKAYLRGGLEEERRVKKEIADEKMEKEKAERAENFERTQIAKKNRKIEMERMLADLRVKRDDLVQKRLELTREVSKMSSTNPDFNKKKMHIRMLDQELGNEFYQILKDKPEPEKPSVPDLYGQQKIDEDHRKRQQEDAEHVKRINECYEENLKEYNDLEDINDQKLKEAEERMQRAEQEEIERRQRGTSSAVIPAAIPQLPASGYNSGGSGKKDYVAGAVSGTESESESEFITTLRGNRKRTTFKWTQEYEDILEELLIKH